LKDFIEKETQNLNYIIMQFNLSTVSGQALTNEIFDAVENETLKTWLVRESKTGTKYLTHKPDQWYDKALFVFKVKKDKLVILLTWLKGNEPAEDIKGYYMGRFTEILLVNFSDKFDKFEIIK
jgi:hypothetical protein